jgi:hypothetical protein
MDTFDIMIPFVITHVHSNVCSCTLIRSSIADYCFKPTLYSRLAACLFSIASVSQSQQQYISSYMSVAIQCSVHYRRYRRSSIKERRIDINLPYYQQDDTSPRARLDKLDGRHLAIFVSDKRQV